MSEHWGLGLLSEYTPLSLLLAKYIDRMRQGRANAQKVRPVEEPTK